MQDVSPRVSVTLQGSITEDGLCIEYEARDAEAVERANGQDGLFRPSLTPHFVNNDYVTAESICSTVQAPHEVLAWSRAI